MTIVQLARTHCVSVPRCYPKAAMMKSSRIIEQYKRNWFHTWEFTCICMNTVNAAIDMQYIYIIMEIASMG